MDQSRSRGRDMSDVLQELADKASIQDAIARYARAVDRGDWAGVRAAYHPDAHDDHGSYQGGVDGLINYLQVLLAGAEGGMHMIGNCLIELASPDLALAETYFISQRLRPPTEADPECGPRDRICRLGWGRYIDRFERRGGEWRVARRIVAMDAVFSLVALAGARSSGVTWGTRDGGDPLVAARAAMTFGRGA